MPPLLLPAHCIAQPFTLPDPPPVVPGGFYVVQEPRTFADLASSTARIRDVAEQARLVIPVALEDCTFDQIITFWQAVYTPFTADFNGQAHVIFRLNNLEPQPAHANQAAPVCDTVADVARELIAHGVPLALGTANTTVELARLMTIWMDGMEIRVESGQAAQQVYLVANDAQPTHSSGPDQPVEQPTPHSSGQLTQRTHTIDSDAPQPTSRPDQAVDRSRPLASNGSGTIPAALFYQQFMDVLQAARWQDLSYSLAPPAQLLWQGAGMPEVGTISPQ